MMAPGRPSVDWAFCEEQMKKGRMGDEHIET